MCWPLSVFFDGHDKTSAFKFVILKQQSIEIKRIANFNDIVCSVLQSYVKSSDKL